jgi:hypothetical protein
MATSHTGVRWVTIRCGWAHTNVFMWAESREQYFVKYRYAYGFPDYDRYDDSDAYT